MQLRKDSLLQGGKYRIVQVLGQGGFGITYLAEQPMLERKVCIKEFFFKGYCERNNTTSQVTLTTNSNQELVERFRKKFLKEARVISKLHHDHIVQIHDIFEENSTAYYVMDYIEGESLADLVKRVGFLPEQQALAYIRDVANALTYIHSRSINHLDIKPSNIMFRHEDHRLLLIDFGVSKQYDESTFEGTTTTPVGISHGYSPAEQYRRNGVQSFSPQSDVYALASTLYKLLTGVTPPEAIEVQDEGLPLEILQSKHVSNTTISAIVQAMKSRTQRTQSVEAFVASLSEPDEETVAEEHTPKKDSEFVVKQKTKQEHQSLKIMHKYLFLKRYVMIVAVIAAIIICGLLYLTKEGGHQKEDILINNIAENGYEQKEENIEVTGTENGYEYVDLGLSVKWATKNVGATSPSDYGGYYAWGETKTKSYYNWDNYFDLKDDEYVIYRPGGKTAITPKSGHDTARENWGGKWRMPTDAENKELCNKCKWKWTNKGSHCGYTVIGPNGKSIFLPATGYRIVKSTRAVNSKGRYWSSTYLNNSNYSPSSSCFLGFDSENHYTDSNDRRCGYNVRPVID